MISDSLMVDRSEVMKEKIYIQLENSETLELYSISLFIEVIEKFVPVFLE